MDLSKLTKGHIVIIGLVIAVLLGVAFWLLGPHKTRQNLAAWGGRKTAADNIIATKPQKEADLVKAKQEVREKQALWGQVETTKMPKPPIDLSNPDPRAQTEAMIVLWKEPAKTVPLMERFALNTNNVVVTTNFGVGGQPTNPAAIPQQVIEWQLGTVTVQGTFQDIVRYMKRWNQAGRVVAVDNFALTGTSPFLSATANITVYIFPKPNPRAQQAQQGYGGGAYGGGPGGYMDPGTFGGEVGGPGMAPGMGPGMAPGMGPGMAPGMGPGGPPGMAPGAVPGP